MSKNMETAVLLDIYGGMLTEKQSDTLSLYYNEDFSLTEIAENSGITRQGVHRCIRSAEEYLIQLEQTLGVAEKYRRISKACDELERLVSNSKAAEGEKEKLLRCIDEIKDAL